MSLEKIGALEKSAQLLEKAISLIGESEKDKAVKDYLHKKLFEIKQRITLMPIGLLPKLSQSVTDQPNAIPSLLVYFGGMINSYSSSLNGRLGCFLTESVNGSAEIGIMNVSGGSALFNMGLLAYTRKGMYVTGAGLSATLGSGSTAFSLRLSVGLSILNKKKKSSLDIFLDVNKGLAKGSLSTWGLSIGKSIYFGKRK
jgi:hypothetical protein